MGKIVTTPLPHDLPENWNETQYIAPDGSDVGLTEQHGYNYLMKMVNDSQRAIQELDEGTLSSSNRFHTDATASQILSQIGWYRIAQVDGTTNGNASALLFLGHNYGSGGPSSLIVALNFNMYAPSIVVLDHKSSATPFFDKIRIVSDSTNKKSYLEVHYNRAMSNSVNAGVLFFAYDALAVCSTQAFVAVSDTPVDGSVLLTQNIDVTKNGTAVTSGGGTITGDVNFKGDYIRLMFTDSTDRTAFFEKAPTNSNEFRVYNTKDSDNRSILVLNPETSTEDELLRLITLLNGVNAQRKVLHTGNMLNHVAPVGLVYASASVNTDALLNSTLTGWINSMPAKHIRNYVLNINAEGLALTGGMWFLTISKASSTHASIVATRYDESGIVARACSLNGGVLTGWASFTSTPVVAATLE